MTQILTNDFRTNLANIFLSDIKQKNIFMFASQTIPASNATPLIESEDELFYTAYDEAIFGKYVSNTDYSLMIPNIEWQSNTVYTKYDNSISLRDESFYVVTKEGTDYSVFKCLDNNGGSNSTNKPVLSETSASDELYQTADGYVWKLMYTFPTTDYDKFATDDFVPFTANYEVSANAVSGAIDVINVDSGGVGYSSYCTAAISQINVGGSSKKFYIEAANSSILSSNTGYYSNCAVYVSSGTGAGQLRKIDSYGIEGTNKFIVVNTAFTTSLDATSMVSIAPNIVLDGDGSDFQGIAVIDSTDDSIESIQVVNRGSGYSYANVQIGANTTALTSNTFTEASLRAIIPPYGGHGYDQQKELFGHYVCISKSFVGSELPTANNDFRSYGLMENPLFRSAELDLASVSGITEGANLSQEDTGAHGLVDSIDVSNSTVTLANVEGVFDTSNVSVGNTEYIVSSVLDNNDLFDQRTVLDVTITSGTGFEADEQIIQESTNGQAYIHEISNTNLYVVQTKYGLTQSSVNEIIGQESGTKAVINTITQPAIYDYSGKILYMENFDPITRFDAQSESIRLIIGF